MARPQPKQSFANPAPSPAVAPARHELRALTGLRGIAAWHVFFFHAINLLFLQDPNTPLSAPARFLATGYTAVSLFFVLSGFVLAYRYLDDKTPFSSARFFRARFARVYPTYFLVWAVLAIPLRHLPWQNWASSFLLLQAWWPRHALAWNSPGWSLSVEALSYAIFPLLVAPARRLGARAALLAAAAAWLAGMYFPYAYLAGLPPLGHGVAIEVLKFNPLIRLPEFLIGVLVGVWFLRAKPRWSTRLASLAVGGAVAALVAIETFRWLPYPFLHNAALSPLFALLIVALAQERERVAHWLTQRWLQRLGEASYAIYLVHMPVLVITARHAPGLPAWAILTSTFLLSTALGYALHLAWEVPCRRRVMIGGHHSAA